MRITFNSLWFQTVFEPKSYLYIHKTSECDQKGYIMMDNKKDGNWAGEENVERSTFYKDLNKLFKS